MKKIEDKIKKYISNSYVINIIRDEIDDEKMLATLLKTSSDFLLVSCWYDFIFNGYKIIRISDITSIEHGDSEIFVKKILDNEKILTHNESIDTLDLNNWKSIFSWLSSSNATVIVESESLDESEFYIGRISEIESESVEILQFDGAGIWDKEPSVIQYENISSITFNDNYSLLMGKYADEN